MNMKNKGFTLVELLAVIVIIGILSVISIVAVSRLISRSRDTQKSQQKNTLQIAAENYLQENRMLLPKSIGKTTTVTAKELKNSGYLKEDVKDSKGNSCMDNSLVIVKKTSSTKYDYTASLYCGNEKAPSSETVDEPIIKISFVDEEGRNAKDHPEILKDVSIARFKIDFMGNSDKTIAIQGYSYSILVAVDDKNSSSSNTTLKEAYSSGPINGKGAYEIGVNKALKDYIDITQITTIKIKTTAINEAGGIKEYTTTYGDDSVKYNDTVKPTCDSSKGKVQAKEGDWLNKKDFENNKTRNVSVYCKDGDGSGCIRDEFKKTWPNSKQKSAIYGYIQVEDNAGNKNVSDDYDVTGGDMCNANYNTSDPCLVRVYVDTVSPVIEVDAYKRNGNGKATGNSVLNNAVKTTAGSKDDSATIKSDQYTNLSSGWMNKTNYGNGIVYTITLRDDIYLDSWKWETNPSGVTSTQDSKYVEYKDTNPDAVKETKIKDDNPSKYCGKLSNSITIAFTGEGRRKGKLTVKDKAGNVTTYIIEANLDKTAPTCASSGGNPNWTNKNITLLGTCSDAKGGSGCKGNVTKSFTTNTNLTNQSPGTVYDNAGNATSCPGNQTVKIDKTAPTCTNSGGGSNWTNKNVTITGTCKDTGGSGCKGNVTKPFTTNTNKSGVSPGTVYDNAGNSATCPSDRTIKIDKTAPKCTSTGGSSSWTNKDVTITGTCSDTGGSGCTGNATKNYTSNTNSTKETPGKVYDHAGNSADCPANRTVKIDKTAPTCTNSGGSSNWTNKDVTITGTCSDKGGSGCKGNVTIPYTSNTNLTNKSPGTVYDNAGNSTPCKADRTIKIDKTPPTCSVSAKAGSSSYSSGTLTCSTVTVTGTCSDKGGSGCTGNATKSTSKSETIQLSVKDNAGNTANCSSVVVKHGTNSASSACTCKTYKACVKGSCNTYYAWSDWKLYKCAEQETGGNAKLPSNTTTTQYAVAGSWGGCNNAIKYRTRSCKTYNYTRSSSCTCETYNTCCHQ